MNLGRALRYSRRYRNWWELERERSAGRVPRRAELRTGRLSFESPDDVNVLRVVRGVFFQHYYSPPGFEIGPQDTVVDVGANIGTFSVWAARRTLGPVLAIEPFPGNVEFLERNLRANGCSSVDVVVCALTDRDAPVRLFVSENGVSHQLSERTHKIPLRGAIEVEGKTLETLIREKGLERIDLLKLDCEGAEGQILGSASRDVLARVRRIAMEFHDYASPLDHDALEALLRENGFSTRLDWDGSDVRGFVYAWR